MTRRQLELALKAFRAGFAAGAAHGSMPTKTTRHWRRGFEAGRAAADSEETAYRKEIASR